MNLTHYVLVSLTTSPYKVANQFYYHLWKVLQMGKQRANNKQPLTEAQKLQVKKDNFMRVLPPRMNKALKAIRMVGDCTLASYSYTPDQAKIIVENLHLAVNQVKDKFEGIQGKSGGFTLPK